MLIMWAASHYYYNTRKKDLDITPVSPELVINLNDKTSVNQKGTASTYVDYNIK